MLKLTLQSPKRLRCSLSVGRQEPSVRQQFPHDQHLLNFFFLSKEPWVKKFFFVPNWMKIPTVEKCSSISTLGTWRPWLSITSLQWRKGANSPPGKTHYWSLYYSCKPLTRLEEKPHIQWPGERKNQDKEEMHFKSLSKQTNIDKSDRVKEKERPSFLHLCKNGHQDWIVCECQLVLLVHSISWLGTLSFINIWNSWCIRQGEKS